MLWANPKGKEKLAFIASSLYIFSCWWGAAFALSIPVVLAARDHEHDLTIYNTAAGNHGLSVGPDLVGCIAAVLALGQFCVRLPHVSRKVQLERESVY